MKPKSAFNPFSRRASYHALSLVSIVCGGSLYAADLVKWDIPTGISSPAAGSTQGTPTLGTGVAAASGITLTGCVTGTTASTGWRWYDGVGQATDLASALAQNNYFAYTLTASEVYSLSINGLGATSFNKGGSAPSTLALLYSATNTWTPGNFREVSSAVAIPTTKTDLASLLAGDLATTPITLNSGETGYFRIAYWGATTTTSGTIWHADTVSGNDFSLLGTATATSVVHNLRWTGSGGNNWNTSPGNLNWADIDLANAPAAFITNDNVTIDTAAAIAVDAGGVAPNSVTVAHASGTVSLGGGSITTSSLVKNGAGTLSLTSSNSISGGSSLNGGITEISDGSSLGSQLITLAGATLRVNAPVASLANSFSLGVGGGGIENASALSLAGFANSTLNNSLTKTGAGDLNLTNGLGTVTTGPVNITVSAGSLTASGTTILNLGSTVTLDGDLNLSGPAIAPHASTIGGTASIVFKSASSSINPRFNGGAVRINVPIELEADGRVDVANGNNNLNLNSGISGPHNFTKNGNGTAVISQPSTYTGTTTIAAGILRMGNLGSPGAGDIFLTQASSQLTFGIAAALNVPNLISGLGSISMATDSVAPVTLGPANTYTGPTNILSSSFIAPVIADGSSSSSIGASDSSSTNLVLNGGALVYTGPSDATTDRSFTLGISGGRFSTTGGGAIHLTSTDTVTLTEPTQVLVGNMSPTNFYQIRVLGNTDWAALGAPLGFTEGTIFQPNGPGSGTGEVVFANTRFLALDGSSPGISTFAPSLNDAENSPVGMTKAGTTTWAITGESNSNTGPVNINGGILRFDSLNPDVTGNITVASGASLGGNGSAGGAVTLQSGGGLAAKISNWTGSAGTGYDDLSVASLDATSVPMTLRIDTTGLVNFTESAKSFTILNTTGGITNFNPANVSVTTTGFPGTGTWSLTPSGNSLVLSYALAGADPYLAWATGSPYNLAGNNALPGSDPDNDGIKNSIEFVIGGNPASVSDTGKLPSAVVSGSNLVFTFRRSDLSAYLNPTVQYGSDLSGWTTAQNGVNGVSIGAPTNLEAGIKQIVVTIPLSLAQGAKLFARLNVVVP